MIILNSLTVPKKVKGGIWDFFTFLLLQIIKKMKDTIQKFSKMSETNLSAKHQDTQRGSLVCFRGSGRRF